VDRRTRNLFALALVVVVVITGGAALILGGGSPQRSGPPEGTVAVVGVVVAVDSGGLTDVRSFTLRTTDGQLLTFGLADLQNGVEFPPGHLGEHQLTASPVRVWYRPGDDPPQAIRLEDAT
jgi:hypothetical protein